MDPNALVAEIIELGTACQTGAATDDERARLERLLEDSEEARRLYLRIADDTVTLNDLRRRTAATPCDDAEIELACDFSPLPAPPRRRWRWMAVAAAAALVGASTWMRSLPTRDVGATALPISTPAATATFARIVSMSNVAWADNSRARREWERIAPGDTLALDAGSIELLFDNGVQFVLQGPAHCEFLASGRVLAHSGKLVARVGPEATGFEIDTPHAKVIDLGTSFGMTIDPERHSDVVVYEGLVDLSLPETAPRRLMAGEAMRIDRDGHVGRIASVAGDAFLPPPRLGAADAGADRVLVGVSDNLMASQTAKYYRVVSRGFREDCQAYVDRRHQWNGRDERGVPPFLTGGDYVMTFNDDKVQHDLRIAVDVAQPARLYLLVDDRATAPKWLAEAFQDTGWDVGLDEGYDDVPDVTTAVGPGKSLERTCSVWSMDVPSPTTVLLGSLQEVQTTAPPRKVLRAMYGIVATPLAAASGR